MSHDPGWRDGCAAAGVTAGVVVLQRLVSLSFFGTAILGNSRDHLVGEPKNAGSNNLVVHAKTFACEYPFSGSDTLFIGKTRNIPFRDATSLLNPIVEPPRNLLLP